MAQEHFTIERPRFDVVTGLAQFSYRLNDMHFVETLDFPVGGDGGAARSSSFARLLDLTALVLGVSYFKLRAPLNIEAPEISLSTADHDFIIDVYENGLGEFYARNNLARFGRLKLKTASSSAVADAADLPHRVLLPVGGGKDSLVSVELIEAAGVEFTPFAVNPKGPIVSSIAAIGRDPLYVRRTLDPEMIRLSTATGYYNGHVPSTAINSMIASLAALLFGYGSIVLSNERSASEGNVAFDGRQANHQHSKSIDFERMIAGVFAAATGGALKYFSLLRPYSEARIAKLFARETRFDRVFSSCNRNFTIQPHQGKLWCGECPKCLFVFLIFAPVMERSRLLGIFGQNLLHAPQNEASFRALTGLAGQKPWECVGEILEAAACLYALTQHKEWAGDAIVSRLSADLLTQYGSARLESAMDELLVDSDDHLIPPDLARRIATHAV